MRPSQSDAALLERFVSGGEEAAFVTLVRRHGPRVERICRRFLPDEHDVEDVYQATFLTLARKAAGIAWHESVSPWIDGVARRLAMNARSRAARLRSRERTVTSLGDLMVPGGRLPEWFHPEVDPTAEIERRDLRRVLDDELLRLPEKYRAPVVLCDLEGHTREEAARRLGWPAGSMSRRLDRGRSLLRQRLTHRGVVLGLFMVGAIAAAVVLGLPSDRSADVSPIRQAMRTFEPRPAGGDGYATILSEAARDQGSPPDFAGILPAARAARSVAHRIGGNADRPTDPLWSRFASEMGAAAAELERACERSDAPALVTAARRLDASCVQCHAVFRKESVDRRQARRPAAVGRLRDRPERPPTVPSGVRFVGQPGVPDSRPVMRPAAIVAGGRGEDPSANDRVVLAVRTVELDRRGRPGA